MGRSFTIRTKGPLTDHARNCVAALEIVLCQLRPDVRARVIPDRPLTQADIEEISAKWLKAVRK